MAVSQSTFKTTHDEAYEGQIGDSRPCTVESYVASGSAGIGFGKAVVRVAGQPRRCRLAVGTSGADNLANNFLGISLRTTTPRPSAVDPDPTAKTVYQEGTNVSVLTEGIVWAEVDGGVTAGDDVTFKSNGRLGSAAPSGSVKRIPGAVWVDTQAANNGLARLKLSNYRLGA